MKKFSTFFSVVVRDDFIMDIGKTELREEFNIQ